MSKEHDAARVLINQLEKYELEIRALNFVLAAMRQAHPEFPALSLLAQARQHQPFLDEARAIGQRLQGITNAAEMQELLEKWPTAGEPN